MASLAVVIPLYKPALTDEEIISYRQCLKILCNYDIYLVCPEDLNTMAYKEINDEQPVSTRVISVVRFSKIFFRSVQGYNEMLLSVDFYKRFRLYDYILIYQLDAYIFHDDLLAWCDKGYDYVGAPWINWYWSQHYSKFMTFPRKVLTKLGYKGYNLVGNGGLSLRKVNSFIFNLTLFKRQAKLFKLNEDYFFSFWLTSYNPFFKIPSVKEALLFSFDENPQDAFILSNNTLPMGCHAWNKYRTFWNSYISL